MTINYRFLSVSLLKAIDEPKGVIILNRKNSDDDQDSTDLRDASDTLMSSPYTIISILC